MENFIQILKSEIEAFKNVDLTPQTDFISLPEWDSVAVLTLIVTLEVQYGVGLKSENIVACKSLEELYKLMLDKK